MCYYKVIISLIIALMYSNLNAGDIFGTVRSHSQSINMSNGLILLNPIRAIQRLDMNGNYLFQNIPAGLYDIVLCHDNTVIQSRSIFLGSESINIDFNLIPGDIDHNGKIDLIDAFLFADRFGHTSVGDILDMNEDLYISEEDFELWYKLSWQHEGYLYRYHLLDDAEHIDQMIIYPPEGKWQTIHDNGSSYTFPAPYTAVRPSSGGYYSDKSYFFEYILGSSDQYPYALIRMLFGDNENVCFDAGLYEGFSVALKGEKQAVIVSLKSEKTSDDWSEYFVRIPSVDDDWQAHTFSFYEDFEQPDWGQQESISSVIQCLQAIQFKADERVKDQTFRLYIDNLFLISKDYDPLPGVITGNLLCNQSPVPAVVVMLEGSEKKYRVLSNMDGSFEFSRVDPGVYTITAFRPGYRFDTISISLCMDENVSLKNLNIARDVPAIKPVSKGSVLVEGRELKTDFDGDGQYTTFFIKGVGYSPVPIGSWGEIAFPERVFQRDMPLLSTMNCNAIRTWGRADLKLLDAAEEYGIKVMAGFWVSTSADFFKPLERLKIIEEFRTYVSENKDHPAILCWSIGNEQNYVNGDNWAWYTLVEDLAVVAYEIEGEIYHPVATPNGDHFRIGFSDFMTRDEDLAYLDIWGMNLYKPDREGFNPTFLIYSAFSGKPLWISEYGIDAYNDLEQCEYEFEQANYAKRRINEMLNSAVCIGSTLMAYSDEWWKAGDPDSHDFGGYSTEAHPDGFSNEEWWGVFSVIKNNQDIDILTKRAIYDTLSVYFSEQ